MKMLIIEECDIKMAIRMRDITAIQRAGKTEEGENVFVYAGGHRFGVPNISYEKLLNQLLEFESSYY